MPLTNISLPEKLWRLAQALPQRSEVLGCNFLPCCHPGEQGVKKLPVLYWLSGLTRTDENFMQGWRHEIGRQLGLIIVGHQPRVVKVCRTIWKVRVGFRPGGGLLCQRPAALGPALPDA